MKERHRGLITDPPFRVSLWTFHALVVRLDHILTGSMYERGIRSNAPVLELLSYPFIHFAARKYLQNQNPITDGFVMSLSAAPSTPTASSSSPSDVLLDTDNLATSSAHPSSPPPSYSLPDYTATNNNHNQSESPIEEREDLPAYATSPETEPQTVPKWLWRWGWFMPLFWGIGMCM